MTSDEIRQKAREYIIANPPKPIACYNCGMAMGLSVDCPKNEKGHLFMVTTGDSEQAEIDKLMGFAESLFGGEENNGPPRTWHCQVCHELIHWNGQMWLHIDGSDTFDCKKSPRGAARPAASPQPAEQQSMNRAKCECICHKVGLLGFFCCPCSAMEIEKMVTCFGPHKQQPHPPATTTEEHIRAMNPEVRAASGSGTPATPTLKRIAEAIRSRASQPATSYSGRPSCHVCGSKMVRCWHCTSCGATSYPTNPDASVLPVLEPAESAEAFWDEWSRTEAGHAAIMRDAGSEIRNAAYLPRLFAEVYAAPLRQQIQDAQQEVSHFSKQNLEWAKCAASWQERAEKAEAELASLKAAGEGWIPCADRLPEMAGQFSFSNRVDFFVPSLDKEDRWQRGRLWQNPSHWQSMSAGAFTMEDVTHWRPLPPSPAKPAVSLV